MSRALIAMSAAAACGAPPPSSPISNAVSITPPAPCELGWLEHADQLTMTESSNGHFGWFDLHVELVARDDEMLGIARASYRRHERAVPEPTSLELRFPRRQLSGVLGALGRGASVPETEEDRRRVFAHDTSQTIVVALEIAARIRGVEHRARFKTTDGQIHPQPWVLGGCDRELSYGARAAMTAEYAKLERLLRRDEILETLEKRAPP